MADGGVGIPVVLDIQADDAIKNQLPKVMRSLREEVEYQADKMSKSVSKAQKIASKGLNGGTIEDMNRKIATYTNSTRLAAQHLLKLAQAQGRLTAGRLDIKALSSEVSVLAAKWNSLKLGSKFDQDGNLRRRAQDILDKMSRLTGQTIKFGNALTTSSKAAAASMSQTNAALAKQSGIWARLSGYVSGYMLLFAGARFVHNIRETTAELEMQRVALGGIIRDTETANDLFQQIKAAALKSPFEIKDLVSFTKQLSAYRIETDKLFDVTMRLADVSAGLGVDMSRLVLAYGQVRAASVLRGQELRQFTEAGIPLVELLAEKFRELGREGTTTADVFELISKRAVPFKMIEDIFNDMTDAGGMFYKMQEKQSETLKGQWMKLRDAITIMYDEMGNTASVHSAMVGLITTLNNITRSWREAARWIGTLTGMIIAYKTASAASALASKHVVKAEVARAAILKSQTVAMPKVIAGILSETAAKKASHWITRRLTVAQYKLATATTLTGKAFWGLYAALMSNPFGAVAAAVVGLGLGIYTLVKNSRKAEISVNSLGQSLTEYESVARKASDTTKLIDAYERLSKKTDRTAKETEKLKRVSNELAETYPNSIKSINEQSDAYDINIAKIKELIGVEQQLEYQHLKSQAADAQKQVNKLEEERRNLVSQVTAGGYYFKGTTGQDVFHAFTEKELDKTRLRLKKIREELEPLKKIIQQIRDLDFIGPMPAPQGTDDGYKPDGDTYRKDPFITRIENRIKFMKDFKKGYDDFLRYMSSNSAKEKELGIMRDRGLGLGLSESEQLRAPEDLSNWYKDQIDAVVLYMNKKGIKGGVTDILRKEITGTDNQSKLLRDFQSLLQSLWDEKTDFDTSEFKKAIENKLKQVKDELKRSETARNFFNEILEATGDEDIATNLAISVYGGIGKDFKERIKDELVGALNSLDEKSISGLDEAIRKAFEAGDYEYLMKNLEKVPKELLEIVKQVDQESKAYNAQWEKDFIKRYQKTKTYAERIATLEKQRTTAENEAREKGKSPDEIAAVTAYWDKQIANVQLEALKDTYTWTKAFEDLEGVSSDTLQNLIKLIDEYITKHGKDLEPQQLKELTRAKERAKQQYVERDAIKSARKAFDDLTKARGRSFSLLLKGQKGTEDYTRAMDDAMEAAKRFAQAVEQLESDINSLISTSKDLFSTFASDKDAQYFSEQMENLSTTVRGAGSSAIAAARLLSTSGADPGAWIQLASGIGDIIAGIGGGANSANLHRLNEQIEDQTHLIENLEYAYSRLETAMADSFGSDYVYNYQQQLANLEAVQAAYEEQARLEREKGKKADEEKIREYERAATETADKIAEKRSELAEFFTGTDLTSAAKDFASAWIEAYKQFGSTTDAMKEKFHDMIESMVTQSLAAKMVQEILDPLFREINTMANDAEGLTATDIAEIARKAPEYYAQIDAVLTQLMAKLGAAGLNIRDNVGSFTGISRNIANASEESINGLAAGINTQNFYMQHIDMNVAAILATLTGGASSAGASQSGEYVDPYKDQMLLYAGHIPTIDQNLASLLSEVRKVIKPRGTTATHYVAVNM